MGSLGSLTRDDAGDVMSREERHLVLTLTYDLTPFKSVMHVPLQQQTINMKNLLHYSTIVNT